MRPLRIAIEKDRRGPLSPPEIKYVFRVLLETAGYPVHFVGGDAASADIRYGTSGLPARLSIREEAVSRAEIKTPSRLRHSDGLSFFAFAPGATDIPLPVRREGENVLVSSDLILASFYFLTGWQERFVSRNSVDFHNLEESYSFQNKLNYNPIVSRYASFIKDVFAPVAAPEPAWPGGKTFAVALTHDVDYPEIIRWVECLRYLAKHKVKASPKKLFEIASGRESFWTFPECLRFEKESGVRTSFYFCGFNKGSLYRHIVVAPDPFYDVEKPRFKELMSSLPAQGFEVGMHSSYLCYKSETMFREEKARVEASAGLPVLGNRHHYLHLNPDDVADTLRMHDRIGFLYDTSLGFERKGGFRYGIASPFYVYDPERGREVDTVELAPTLMDDQLFGYQKYNELADRPREIDLLLDTVKSVNGLMTAIWHPRTLNETFYPGWWDAYRYLVGKVAGRSEIYCDLPVNVARHWKARAEKLRKLSLDENPSGASRLEVPSTAS